MMNSFVQHCGHAMPCACQASAMQVPPPIVPVVPARTFVKWGDFMICQNCKMAQEWCACDKQKTPPPPTQDGSDSSLNRRIKDWKGTP